MNVLIINQSDIQGGAARAAYRLHKALLRYGIRSRMKVRMKFSDDWTVEGPTGWFAKAVSLIRPTIGNMIVRLLNGSGVCSCNLLPSWWAQTFNASSVDIIHLHWIGGETLSVEDIGRIRKPIVWTLHDMWPFCGIEHYAKEDSYALWKKGTDKIFVDCFDVREILNHLTWVRKRRSWKNTMCIVAPSRWIAKCAQESVLFSKNPVYYIPNVLDTDMYRPLNKNFSREVLGLPQDKKIILFGGFKLKEDLRKGYDLFIDSFTYLKTFPIDCDEILCVVAGQNEPKDPPVIPVPIRWFGHLNDDISLVMLYNSADVVVVPSRQDNLPQMATEAQACGCPVVSFSIGGMFDVVDHRVTGYLAPPFDTKKLAQGLFWVLKDEATRSQLSVNARKRALRLWSARVVVPQYLRVYRRVTSAV